MKLLIQNLHKEKHLVCDLIQQHSEPDIMLVQEVNIKSEDKNVINGCGYDCASFTSRMGYGTAIYALKDKKGSSGVDNGIIKGVVVVIIIIDEVCKNWCTQTG